MSSAHEYSSYQEYINAMGLEDWPQCKWLNWFFELEATGNPKYTPVTVLDSADGHLSKSDFFVTDLEQLDSKLRSEPLNTTRIVVLAHDGWKNVNKNAVAMICHIYNIDPLFVMSHFYWDHDTSEKDEFPESSPNSPPNVSKPVSLPSLVDFT